MVSDCAPGCGGLHTHGRTGTSGCGARLRATAQTLGAVLPLLRAYPRTCRGRRGQNRCPGGSDSSKTLTRGRGPHSKDLRSGHPVSPLRREYRRRFCCSSVAQTPCLRGLSVATRTPHACRAPSPRGHLVPFRWVAPLPSPAGGAYTPLWETGGAGWGVTRRPRVDGGIAVSRRPQPSTSETTSRVGCREDLPSVPATRSELRGTRNRTPPGARGFTGLPRPRPPRSPGAGLLTPRSPPAGYAAASGTRATCLQPGGLGPDFGGAPVHPRLAGVPRKVAPKAIQPPSP